MSKDDRFWIYHAVLNLNDKIIYNNKENYLIFYVRTPKANGHYEKIYL